MTSVPYFDRKGAVRAVRVTIHPLQWQLWPAWYVSELTGARCIHLGPLLIEVHFVV